MSRSRYRIARGSIYALSLGIVFYLAYRGSSYYLTPLIERPRHDAYWIFKPGGSLGYLLGVAGSFLMIVMHVYSLRRRVRELRRFGPLSVWLDFHIYCGVFGPLLIVLHSSFKVHGLVALSFWSMVAVAISGILGRYLYQQLPRRQSGDELTLAEMEQLDGSYTTRLRDEFGLSESDLERLDEIATGDLQREASLFALILRLPVQGIALRWRLRRFGRRLRVDSKSLVREMRAVARRKALLERRILLWEKLRQLFYYWHVFHKPFAIVMYLFMIVHIVVVSVTGYGWLPGR
jgi:hypothetical protein